MPSGCASCKVEQLADKMRFSIRGGVSVTEPLETLQRLVNAVRLCVFLPPSVPLSFPRYVCALSIKPNSMHEENEPDMRLVPKLTHNSTIHTLQLNIIHLKV